MNVLRFILTSEGALSLVMSCRKDFVPVRLVGEEQVIVTLDSDFGSSTDDHGHVRYCQPKMEMPDCPGIIAYRIRRIAFDEAAAHAR